MALATFDAVQLAWEERGAVATLRVVPLGDGGDLDEASTTLRFTATDGRVRIGLVLLDGHREIDVSIQPALVTRVLGGGAPSTEATALVCRWLAAFAGAHGIRCPDDLSRAGLLAVVGGVSFPLLGAAVTGGAGPLEEVPRWAAGPLAAPTARAGAQVAFPGRATRPVVAALAEALVSGVPAPARGGDPARGPGTVALYPLALACMAPALGPDRLARVLAATDPWRAPGAWPEVDLVDRAARLTPHLGEHRTERLLLDAARLDDGPALLAEAVEAYGLVRPRAGARLPNRLAEFREHCRTLLPPDPNPSGVVAPTRRRPRARAATTRRPPSVAPRPAPPRAPTAVAPAPPPPPPTPEERRRAMFHAPRTRGSQPAEHVPLEHPAAVLALRGREVAGSGRDPLRLVVPRTGAELAAWGERLHNCLGGFAAAVNEGRSIVVGVESCDRLVYGIEVRPDGVIRQFLATHNRPVPRPDARAVVGALAAAGVVRADAPANGHWLDPS